MSKTVKKDAKFIKPGQKLMIPAQQVIVRLVDRLDVPSFSENLLVLEVCGLKGPWKGAKTCITCWEGDKVDFILPRKPLRWMWDQLVKLLWDNGQK